MRYTKGQRVIIDSPGDAYHHEPAIVRHVDQNGLYLVTTKDKQVHSMSHDELYRDGSNQHKPL